MLLLLAQLWMEWHNKRPGGSFKSMRNTLKLVNLVTRKGCLVVKKYYVVRNWSSSWKNA